MRHQPRASKGPQPFDSDSGAADEKFPPTRFFTDALNHSAAPLKRRKRKVAVLVISAGFGLGVVALLGLAALLTL
jgi:hypothetical protein